MISNPKPTPTSVIPAKAGIHTISPIDSGFRRNDAMGAANDRLSRAIYFANELSDSRLRKTKTSWTPARRKKQSLQIHKVRPWRVATGPRTVAEKLRSAANANKGKGRDARMAMVNDALRSQSLFLRCLKQKLAFEKAGFPLSDASMKLLLFEGRLVTRFLLAALVFSGFPASVTERNNE